MPLNKEEKAQALDLAKGMLLAQRDNLSMAGNLLNNPHFANVDHSVKLEALRQYAKLENEGPYKTTVNIEPDRKEMAKAIGRAALMEGAISLPLSAAIGTIGAVQANTGNKFFLDSLRDSARAGKLRTHLKGLAPLAGTLFAANAAVGGTREALKQRAALSEARTANKYLDKIRSSTSEADLNAMLLGAADKHKVRKETLKKSLEDVDTATAIAPAFGIPVMTEDSAMAALEDPQANLPAQTLMQWGEYMDRDLEDDRDQTKQADYKPKKNWNKKPTLRNTAPSSKFKAQSAKIRKEQFKKYNTAVSQGTTHKEPDIDQMYRVGKAAAKKFLKV